MMEMARVIVDCRCRMQWWHQVAAEVRIIVERVEAGKEGAEGEEGEEGEEDPFNQALYHRQLVLI